MNLKPFLFLFLLACLIAPAAAAGGSGTAASPYIIETPAELQSIANNLAAHYVLTSDIDCSGVSWTAIGTESAPFIGSLDGNGHQIKNLAITGANRGMFGIAGPGAEFRDIQFVDCTVSGTSTWTGMLCGAVIMSASLHTQCQIINVDTTGCSVISTSYIVGGILGRIQTSADVYMADCDVAGGNVESSLNFNAGGILGVVSGASSAEIESVTVTNMHVKTVSTYAGGILGVVSGASSAYVHDILVQNCVIESPTYYIGGIIGSVSGASSGTFENGVVENCVVKAGKEYAGGVCGVVEIDSTNNIGSNLAVSNVDVTDCTIYTAGNYAGGIAGRINTLCTGIFADCAVSDCTILANRYAAGICPAYS